MNESEKNIETCLPESILAEVASVPTEPQFVSLVNESFDPLQQQAVQQAGSDAYNEVVASHQPYTFTSPVRQMKSNLILLLRRFWRFPFGSGTLRSLSDMWQHYIHRLQGSETYGIPSRLDQLTDLPSAPLLVADRRITNGNNQAAYVPDGISFARLLCCKADMPTELIDTNNHGWVWDRNIDWSQYPSLEKIVMNCGTVAFSGLIFNAATAKEIRCDYIPVLGTSYIIRNCANLEKLYLNGVERAGGWSYDPTISDCPKLKEVYAESYHEKRNQTLGHFVNNLPELWLLKLGYIDNYGFIDNYGKIIGPNNPKLIHVEIKGCNVSIDLSGWNPSHILSDNPTGTDLVEDPTAHPTWNNLQQFLSNFRSFIVLRLANRKTTTALTLTLSAAVYNAVTGANSGWASQHTLAELGITAADLTDLETELGITSATIYASWLDTYTGANGIHWDINKAN